MTTNETKITLLKRGPKTVITANGTDIFVGGRWEAREKINGFAKAHGASGFFVVKKSLRKGVQGEEVFVPVK